MSQESNWENFVHITNHSLFPSFLPILGKKHFDEFKEKTPKSHHIFFLSLPPNQTPFKKFSLLIFSLKFYIHSISHPNKDILKLNTLTSLWFELGSEGKQGYLVVRGPFSDAQSRVVHWRDDLTRPKFFLGSYVRNSTSGHMVQRLPAYSF